MGFVSCENLQINEIIHVPNMYSLHLSLLGGNLGNIQYLFGQVTYHPLCPTGQCPKQLASDPG